MPRQRDDLLFDLAYILLALAQNLTGEATSEFSDLGANIAEADCVSEQVRKLAHIASMHALNGLRLGAEGSAIDAASIAFALYKAIRFDQPSELEGLWIFRGK